MSISARHRQEASVRVNKVPTVPHFIGGLASLHANQPPCSRPSTYQHGGEDVRSASQHNNQLGRAAKRKDRRAGRWWSEGKWMMARLIALCDCFIKEWYQLTPFYSTSIHTNTHIRIATLFAGLLNEAAVSTYTCVALHMCIAYILLLYMYTANAFLLYYSFHTHIRLRSSILPSPILYSL